MLRPALRALATTLSLALAPIAFVPAAIAQTAASPAVTGTATYLERIAVPEGAHLVVELLDTSLQDAKAVQMSAQRFALTGVPQGFALPYDPALIDDRMTYTVSARVEKDGHVLFRSTTSYPVLTRDFGDQVEIVMEKMAPRPMPTLAGTTWRGIEIMGDTLTSEKRPELMFDEGRVGVATGCNRYSGGVEIGDRTLRFSDKMAGTLMACPPPYDAQEHAVLDLLPRVTDYLRSGNDLGLLDAEGVVLMRLTLTE